MLQMINDFIGKITGSVLSSKGNKENEPPKEIKKKIIKKPSIKSKEVKPKVQPPQVIIHRSENLPRFSGLISISKKLRLPVGLENEYIVLKDASDDKSVYVVCHEKKISLKIDNDFLQIRNRCKEQGFNVKRLFTTKNIIDITYSTIKKSDKGLINKDNEGEYHELFDQYLRSALEKGSSDIILSLSGGSAKVKMRIKGRIKVVDELTEERARSLASVTYTSLAESGAKDTTFNERKPQDGIVNRNIDGQNVSIRLATIPAHPDGFDVTLRVMPVGTTQREQKLISLGYNEVHAQLIDYATTIPTGCIVISGVTGSGKTTTLATLIRKIIRESNGEKRVITIEDPPEHRILDATQVPVVRSNKDINETSPFNAAMRAALRSDPDVLMPGEIRDSESAKLMVDATLSGHQVYTTVHAPSMFDILIRLRELGIRSSVLGSSSFISALIYQSLIRTLCPCCSHNYGDYLETIDKNSIHGQKELATIDRIKKAVGLENIKRVKFKNDKGCPACDFEGVSGREVIAEVVVPDRKMKTLFMDGKDEEAISYYEKSGGKYIVDHGIEKLLKGKVDIHDLEDKVGRIDMTDTPLKGMLEQFNENETVDKKDNRNTDEDFNILEKMTSSLGNKNKKESGQVLSIKKEVKNVK